MLIAQAHMRIICYFSLCWIYLFALTFQVLGTSFAVLMAPWYSSISLFITYKVTALSDRNYMHSRILLLQCCALGLTVINSITTTICLSLVPAVFFATSTCNAARTRSLLYLWQHTFDWLRNTFWHYIIAGLWVSSCYTSYAISQCIPPVYLRRFTGKMHPHFQCEEDPSHSGRILSSI